MADFKKDDAVQIRHSQLNGLVVGFGTNDEGFVYLVEYADNDGVEQSRFFSPDQIVAA